MTTTRLIACKAHPDYELWLRFGDGVAGRVNLGGLIEIGAFTMWRYRGAFNAVRVDDRGQSVVWDAGVRLDAEVLYRDLIARGKRGRPPQADPAFNRFMARVLEAPKQVRRARRRK